MLEHPIVRTAFVSTYPPRQCGIATFTSDLARVSRDREVVALHPADGASPYPHEVHHRLRRDEPSDYARTARVLTACVDVVSLQHESGIWGGDDGEYVLDFIRALGVPAVATLHAIPGEPTPRQRAILVELAATARATVVMSRAAATVLTTAYGVDPAKLEIIPHGVPDVPIVSPETTKPDLGLEGRQVILSFGLLSPGKGCELVLDALPAVVAEDPTVCYVIVGATHPDLVRRDGEAYRGSLVERVEMLRLRDNVRFVDRFVGRSELIRWLQSADVVVTPYPNLDQAVSGTLAYAMGAGRPVVSTAHGYATELLADERGVLVPGYSPEAFAAALNRLLEDSELREAYGRRAYEHSRHMVWSEVGAEYRQLFARTAADAQIPRLSPHLAASHA